MRLQSASDIIIEDIKNSIIQGKLKAGDKLPSERELAKHYEFSRIPVREALKALANMGFIESKQGKGTFIREPDATPIIESIFQPLLADDRVVLELIALRKLMETQGAKEAARLRTDEDLTIIRAREKECNDSLSFGIASITAFQTSDYHFHLAIAKASQSTLYPKFLSIIEKSLNLHQMYSFLMHKKTVSDRVSICHKKLVDAIADRNEKAAGEAMENHLTCVEKDILFFLKFKKN